MMERKTLRVIIPFCLWATAAAWPQSVTLNGASQNTIWLVNDQGNLNSETVLSLTASAPMPAWVEITVPGKPAYLESLGDLAVGTNARTVHVLELATDSANVAFRIFPNAAGAGTALDAKTLAQKRIRRWKMYVAADCHVDIGYTDYQEDLKKKLFPAYLDSAFDYIDATSAWPVESRFTYPIESSFMIYDAAMVARDADWLETLKGHLASGRMSYPASYFNYDTGTLGAEELARANYISNRTLKDMLGIPPTRVGYATDSPSFSWAMVDALAESGVKGYRLRFNDNRAWSKWDIARYPQMFFIQGRDPANKMLIWNGPSYWNENTPIGPNFGFKGSNSDAALTQVMAWFAKLGNDGWAYDSWLSTFTTAVGGSTYLDNRGIHPAVMARIKGVNDLIAAKGYAYPKIIASNHGDFFEHILADYAKAVPLFKGNIESSWNLGVPSGAYETGRNKAGQDKLATAETFATLAGAAIGGAGYPHDRLSLAWKNMLSWDEHTWGAIKPGPDDQWRWKRNTAFISDNTGDAVLGKSLQALASGMRVAGRTVSVFNGLAWERSDLVRVPLADLPPYFDIVDGVTGTPVKYQKLEDGNALFQAEKVPGMGYKQFRVAARADEPSFPATVRATANGLENAFFKVTFDTAGCISSILDKNHGNREMVDPGAPARLNQIQTNAGGFITSAALYPKSGPVAAEMVSDGVQGSLGMESLQRHVILYDNLPRLDIVNEALKADSGFNWDSHFIFPWSVDNFTIRHEMPTGSFMPYVTANVNDKHTEQFYTSSTDQYAVNRWIDISNNKDYGITFCPLTAPMVSYGGRRAQTFDVNYNHKDPWIWSQIYNNHKNTNWQLVQPGRTVFRYSVRSHGGADWAAGGASRFGAEAANPLRAAVIQGAQAGNLDAAQASFLGIDMPNVALSTAKDAEANGDGLILRYNEIEGRNTHVTVDLSWLNPLSAMETDLVENDRAALPIKSGRVEFDIPAYGWKTVRVTRGTAPAQTTGVKAAILADGCRVSWNVPADTALGYYEVYRSTQADFGTGIGYLGTSENPWFFDAQVVPNLSRSYYYRVRAVRSGLKGPMSQPIQALAGTFSDTHAPSAPELVRVERLHGTRISLEWNASSDDKYVAGYDVFRDGRKIATLDPILNSHLDVDAAGWNSLPYYQVAAFDKAGNRSLSRSMTSGPALPNWANLAPGAAVTVSSEFDAVHGKAKSTDGAFGKSDTGEWASSETNPWIRLAWTARKSVGGVVLYDRSKAGSDVNGGTLTFSDGSSLKVVGIPTWGEGRLITFPWKQVEWVKFQAEGGRGQNVGLAEMAILGEERLSNAILKPQRETRAWKTLQGEGGVGNSDGGRKNARP